LTEVHLVVGVAVLALNLFVGVWGLGAALLHRTPVSFWYVLRAAQISVVVQVLLGAILLVAGHEPKDAIHYMYGTAPLLVNLLAEGMRTGAAQRELPEDVQFEGLPAADQRAIALRIVRREMMIMSFAALLVTAFAVRAAQVSGAMF
jgi:hypothetical protein